MKKKPVDVTELFGSCTPHSYESSKEYLESLNGEEIVETLYLVNDSKNYKNKDLIYMVGLNYDSDEHEDTLTHLDYMQMANLKNEVEQVLLSHILEDYEKSLKNKGKIIKLF